MKFYLIVAKGSKQGLPILVSIDLFLIGSDKMCQLRKRSLGPKHCAFVTRDKKVFVRDMDSGEPTLVNGTAIPTGDEWPLHSGDRVTVGTLEFMIQFREHGLEKKDLEEWAMRSLDEQKEEEFEDDEFVSSGYKSASSAAQSIFNQLNAMKGEVKGRLRVGAEKGVMMIRFNDAMLVDESEIALVKKELCDTVMDRPNQRVLLDFKSVRRLSSSAVMMLADFFRWLRPSGSSLAFCRVRPELESAMALLRVEHVPIFKDKKTAITSRW
jgi:anti-anti-sigma regulatory factor